MLPLAVRRRCVWTGVWIGIDTHRMRFMVIETFKNGDPGPAGERFARQGRMLPESVVYEASWLERSGGRCWQLMQAPDRAALDAWIARWSDLIEFEVVPVLTSQEFWAERKREPRPGSSTDSPR